MEAENKILKQIIEDSTTFTTLAGKDIYVLTHLQEQYKYYQDYKNDCWVVIFPNGEIVDTTFQDNILEIILHDIGANQ